MATALSLLSVGWLNPSSALCLLSDGWVCPVPVPPRPAGGSGFGYREPTCLPDWWPIEERDDAHEIACRIADVLEQTDEEAATHATAMLRRTLVELTLSLGEETPGQRLALRLGLSLVDDDEDPPIG